MFLRASTALWGLALALACAACTSPLQVRRVAPGELPPPGLAYPLAYTRFEITITRTLAGCDAQGALVETRVEAGAGHAAPDPSHRYVLHPGPGEALWVASARAGYGATGALKFFNSSVEDRSAQAAVAVGTVMRRLGWLGWLAGAAKAPDCAVHSNAAPRVVDRFHWPPDGETLDGLRPAPVPVGWPAALHLPALQLRLVGEDGQPLRRAPALPAQLQGLPYRLPQRARLQACEGDCAEAVPVLDTEVTAVQAGPLYLLPCEGHALGRTTCVLQLNAEGAATAAGFGQSRAPAEAAAGLARDLLR